MIFISFLFIGCGNEHNLYEENIKIEKNDDYNYFLDLLNKNNFEYVEEVSEKDNFLSGIRTPILINEEIISVYQYSSNEDMERDASFISKDGCSINKLNDNGEISESIEISWVSSPHFFKKNTLIINYVGGNEDLLEFLRNNFGEEFASSIFLYE